MRFKDARNINKKVTINFVDGSSTSIKININDLEDILNNSADWFKIPKEGYYVNKNYIMYIKIKEEC